MRNDLREVVHTFQERQRRRLVSRQLMQIDVAIALDIRRPRNEFAIRRKTSARDLPFVLGKPRDLPGCNIQQPNIVVAVCRVGSDQQLFAIGREIIGAVNLFALVRCEQGTLTRGDFGDEDIRIRSLGLISGYKRPTCHPSTRSDCHSICRPVCLS